jgi:hypothetical protein
LAAQISVGLGDTPDAKSINESMTSETWASYMSGNYKAAIQKANACIDKFKATADRQQKAVDDSKEVVPASPDEPKEREKIFRRGPLNDVGTSLWIKAECHMKLATTETGAAAKAHLQDAQSAYEAAAQYSAARTFDITTFNKATREGGWFWSPSQEAKDALMSHFSGAK